MSIFIFIVNILNRVHIHLHFLLTDWLMWPAGRRSLVWAVERRSLCMSGRNMLRPLFRLCPQRRMRTSRHAQPANQSPPAAPAQRKRANQRVTQSQVIRPHQLLVCQSKMALTNQVTDDICVSVLSEQAKTREMINNLNNKRNAAPVTSSVTSTAPNQVKKVTRKVL